MVFTSEEIALLNDRQIFLQKRSLLEKIGAVFARTEQLLKDTAIGSQFAFPANCHLSSGKTSRGENLLGYPWMVHDYPRLINRDEIFLFLTQCWFGHGFSCSWILTGRHAGLLAGKPLKANWTMATDEHIWDQSIQIIADQFPETLCPAVRLTMPLGNDPKGLEERTSIIFRETLDLLGA